jgi:hypothetical protein
MSESRLPEEMTPSTLGRMRYLLGRLSLKRRTGDDPDQNSDFAHLDEEFDPRVKMTPPLPDRGTPSWTRTSDFQQNERNLVYMHHNKPRKQTL